MGLFDKYSGGTAQSPTTDVDTIYTTAGTSYPPEQNIIRDKVWDSVQKADPQWNVAEEFMLYGAKEWLRGKCGDQVADALKRVKLERRPEIIGHQAVLQFADHHANATLVFTMDLRDGKVVGSVFELSGEDILFLKARLDHE